MTRREQAVFLPPDAESLLDAHLRRWAARHALPPAQAEAIRQAILAVPDTHAETLSFAWWNSLFQGATVPIRQTVDVRRYVDLRRMLNPPVSRTAVPPGVPGTYAERARPGYAARRP